MPLRWLPSCRTRDIDYRMNDVSSPALRSISQRAMSLTYEFFYFFLLSYFPFTFSIFSPPSLCFYLFCFYLCIWPSLLFFLPLFVSPWITGFSAECQTKIDTLIPAVRPSSRRNPPARPPWRTASTTTAQVALQTPVGATVQPWMAIRTDLTRHLSTLLLLS